MSAVTVITPPTLDELAATINREHDLAVATGVQSVQHAINVGEALVAARVLVTPGEWYRWLEENTAFSLALAQVYQRVAHYKHLVGDAPTLEGARKMLIGKPDRAPRGVPKRRPWSHEAQKMNQAGATQREIADVLGVSQTAVCQELNPAVKKSVMERNRRYARNRREAKTALKRQERDAAMKKAGGDISHCYSEVRRLAQRLDRMSARAAYAACEALENEIVKLLKAPSQ